MLAETTAIGRQCFTMGLMDSGRSARLSTLERLTKICLTLPEATREIMGRHAGFKVRKKTFAYFLDDHHGDGIVCVTCKVMPGDNVALSKSSPERYFIPAYIGPKGWVALRLDVGNVDWDEVGELVADSYRRIAPKGLAALVRQGS